MRPPKVFNTAPPPGPGSANEDVPVVIVHDVGVQATDDDAQLFYSVEEEVEEISKALELPDLDAEDSDCGSEFEFSKTLQKVSVSHFITLLIKSMLKIWNYTCWMT